MSDNQTKTNKGSAYLLLLRHIVGSTHPLAARTTLGRACLQGGVA